MEFEQFLTLCRDADDLLALNIPFLECSPIGNNLFKTVLECTRPTVIEFTARRSEDD